MPHTPTGRPQPAQVPAQLEATPLAKIITIVPGVPDYSIEATPARILEQAAQLGEEEALTYMERHLTHRGWTPKALDCIREIEWPERWIQRQARLQNALTEFTFGQWEALVIGMFDTIEWPAGDNGTWLLNKIARLERIWVRPTDQLRVRYWALGILWYWIKPCPKTVGKLQKLFAEFHAQPESMKQHLRRLFHEGDEQKRYDELPEEIKIYRGGIFPTMLLGVSYTFEPSLATMASSSWDGRFDRVFNAAGYSATIALRVPKSAIIGVKEGSPYYGDGCIDVVASLGIPGKAESYA